MMKRKKHKKMVRVTALLFCAVVLFSSMDTLSFAYDDTGLEDSTLCAHHPAHTAECGYSEKTEGIPCAHGHTAECYEQVTSCIHQHTEDCCPPDGPATAPDAESMRTGVLDSAPAAESIAPESAAERGSAAVNAAERDTQAALEEDAEAGGRSPSTCTHLCSQETGCVTERLICSHADGGHDEACGFVQGAEARPCTFFCEPCARQGEETGALGAEEEEAPLGSSGNP